MDVATCSTPRGGVSYALACEERCCHSWYGFGRADSTHLATQLSNECTHTSAEMAHANDRSTTPEKGKSQEWNWKPKSMEWQTPP